MKPSFDFTVETLINDGRLKRTDVDEIQTWLQQQKDLPDLCEEQIACFLISCNNKTEATRITIKAHYTLKKNHPEFFNYSNFDLDEDVKYVLKCGYYSLLPVRTHDGSVVIYQGVRQAISGRYTAAAMKIWVMLFEAICKEHPPKSLIIISDFKKLGVMNITSIRIGPLRHFIHYLQDGLPLKLEAIYAINVSSLVNIVKSLIKPFMKPEVYNGIHFLQPSAVVSTLAQEIGTECLPQELGGELPCIDALHDDTINKLLAMKPFLDAEQRQRREL